MKEKRIGLVPSKGKNLPYYMESIGFNPNQEKIIRPTGYPFYHWLQTEKGAGHFSINGTKLKLNKNSGILLSPNIPHAYQADEEIWQTAYFTFSGKMVQQLFNHLQIPEYAYFEWGNENILVNHLNEIYQKIEQSNDFFGIQASAEVYHFLMVINKYGKRNNHADFSLNLKKLQPLIKWLEDNVANHNIGLTEMATFLDVSPRQLNTIFQKTFEISPYAYFLNLRIRVAKQMLLENKTDTVKKISKQVGFQSTSHFVATFRKLVGFSPDYFRNLH